MNGLLVIIGMAICLTAVAQQVPIDPMATPETKALYRHLAQLPSSGFLFGHQDDLAYGVGWQYGNGLSDVKKVTGSYPALYGWELGRIELDQAVNLDSVPFDQMRSFIREGYKRGGVITISWHLNNPLTGKTAWDPAVAGTIPAILPGGNKNQLYNDWLDKVATFISSLTDEKGVKIPVILRLFHELNGDWFWWGGKNCSPDEIKSLWKYTVGYLRDKKKIHHLLYAFNTDRFQSESAYFDRYPGKEWVDIVGFDVYQANSIASNSDFSAAFEKMLSMITHIAADQGKIPALTEFGYNQLPDSSWWTKVFLPALKKHPVAYVMAWRNAGMKKDGSSEFYVPYPGQQSAKDFERFRKSGLPLFAEEAAQKQLYR